MKVHAVLHKFASHPTGSWHEKFCFKANKLSCLATHPVASARLATKALLTPQSVMLKPITQRHSVAQASAAVQGLGLFVGFRRAEASLHFLVFGVLTLDAL